MLTIGCRAFAQTFKSFKFLDPFFVVGGIVPKVDE
jgi:hypothetical protein